MADHSCNAQDQLSVEERIRSVIAEILNPDPVRLTDDAYLVDDLGADSLDFIEFEIALEEQFQFEIAPDESAELARAIRVGDIAPVVRRKLAGGLKPADGR